MRKTDWSLKRLEAELNNPYSLFSKCFITNEIGMICLEGDKKAEALLRVLIDDQERFCSYAAFCFLLTLVSPDPESIEKIRQFQKSLKNDEAVQIAEAAVARYRKNN